MQLLSRPQQLLPGVSSCYSCHSGQLMGGGTVLVREKLGRHALGQVWEGGAHDCALREVMVTREDEASKASISMIQIAGHSEK